MHALIYAPLQTLFLYTPIHTLSDNSLVHTQTTLNTHTHIKAGWSYPLDVWAIACLAMELRTGDHVFELVHDDIHLRMMMNLLGPIPQVDLFRQTDGETELV